MNYAVNKGYNYLSNKYNELKDKYPVVQAIEERVVGNPYDENGNLKYYTGTGMLDLLDGKSALELIKLGKGLKEKEAATRVIREAQSAKNASYIKNAGTVTVSKSGRTHFKPKPKGSGKYVRNIELLPQQSATVVEPITSAPKKYRFGPLDINNAYISAGTAGEMGLPGLQRMFIDDAQRIGSILHQKKGGKIYIKPENKGKFSRSAKAAGEGVQEHARKVVNNPNATTLQKRRAQFALNAAKWSHKKKKHANGGNIPN